MSIKVVFVSLLMIIFVSGCTKEDPLPCDESPETKKGCKGYIPPNSGPTADAGIDVTAMAYQVVTLDGSATSAPDGESLSYSWSQLSGKAIDIAVEGAVITFEAPPSMTSSSYNFELVVTDEQSQQDTDTVTVTVSAVSLGDNGSVSRDYDALGRVVFVDDSSISHVRKYQYSPAGNIESITSE